MNSLWSLQATTVAGTTSASSVVGGPAAIADDGIGGTEQVVLSPLYLTEFVLEPLNILFSPNVDDYQDGIAETIKRFQECVLGVENLVPDTYFDAFTR